MSDGYDLSELLHEFRDEAGDQLDLLESVLRGLESGEPPSKGRRTELLRALHTLKGNAAMLGLRPMRDYVHAVETFFRTPPGQHESGPIEALFEGLLALRRAVSSLQTEDQDPHLAALGRLPDPTRVRRPAGVVERQTAATHAPMAGGSGAGAGHDTPPRSSTFDDPVADVDIGESVRVPFERLDALLDAVGELVGVNAAFDELQHRHRRSFRAIGIDAEVESAAERLGRSAALVRSMVMDLRLVPVGRVLGRFPALARQLAREQGKRVRVEVEGEAIELDKSTVERLGEPLLHLVRNAIGHGIESPEEREAAGKPADGRISLRAEQKGDRVRVEVEDDGRGLDRDVIESRARELGLADADGRVPDLASVLFRPGFSTRRRVDTVSGRGIGLDVVAGMVRRAQGSIEVAAGSAGGARFTLFLPMRAAIVPAVFFRRGAELLAIPSLEVHQTVQRPDHQRVGRTEMIRFRDHLIPLVDPLRIFRWAESPCQAEAALIARGGERAIAIAADRLVDQREAVVRRLPDFLGHPRGVSGVAVVAEGAGVLLLEPDGLAQLNLELQRRRDGEA